MKKRLLAGALLSALSFLSLNTNAENKISDDQTKWIEFYKKQKFVPTADEMLLNEAPEPQLEKGFTNLYNGENLEGWTALGGAAEFETKGDTIIGRITKGSPSTYLSTNKDDYTDFIFTAELKLEVDGNTGIIFRGQSKPGEKFETVFGPQAEMEDFNRQRFWSGGLYLQGCGGWVYPLWLESHKDVRKAMKAGEWNRITIKAKGQTVRTWVNGIPAALWKNDEYLKGFFSLQVHAGRQGEIHFRNIKVKELPQKAAFQKLFESNDFSKWQHVDGTAVRDTWTVENGVVTFAGKGGSIATKKSYKNFELVFDWKISEGGNSGIKYRTRKNLGLEYQVLDDKKHKDGKIRTHRASDLYELVAAPDDKPVNPVGEWNKGRIVAKGNHIEHWLNGEKVVEIEYGTEDWKTKFSNSKYKAHEGFGDWEGPILLQDHGDVVSYKNIRIREL